MCDQGDVRSVGGLAGRKEVVRWEGGDRGSRVLEAALGREGVGRRRRGAAEGGRVWSASGRMQKQTWRQAVGSGKKRVGRERGSRVGRCEGERRAEWGRRTSYDVGDRMARYRAG